MNVKTGLEKHHLLRIKYCTDRRNVRNMSSLSCLNTMLSAFSECRGGASADVKRLGEKSLGRAAALELHFQVKVRTDVACFDSNQCNIFFNNKLFI